MRIENMKSKKKNLLLKPRRRSKKRLLKEMVDYLKCDCYMFAPLVNYRSRQKIKFSSAIGLETNEASKNKNKKLLRKIMDYMISDSYMYASLVDPPPMASSPKGSIRFVKKVTMEISKRTLATDGTNPIIQSATVVTEDQQFQGNLPEPLTLSQREMVKNMVYSNCRASSVSSLVDSQLNKSLWRESLVYHRHSRR